MGWPGRDVLERIARGVRWWLDPSTRRPLVVLGVLAFGIFLAPLAVDVAKAEFFKLPRWFRWYLGELTMIGLIGMGLRRLATVRESDHWPMVESDRRTQADRWVPWGLRLLLASLAIPILEHPDGLGFADWDFVLDKFEALRRSILVWRQFPWWDPWVRGGFPLAAEPQIGAMSIATPLILGLGTSVGLRVSAILCLMIAVEGAYWLGKLWLQEPWSAASSALIYGLNGGVIINTSWGYIIAMSYCCLPWLAFHSFRIGRSRADGTWLGFWLAFVVMNGIQYISLYAGLLMGTIWLRAIRVQPAGRRVKLLWNTVWAVGVFFSLCGWRLITVLFVLLEDQRGRASYWDESPLAAIHHLMTRPLPNWSSIIPVNHLATYIETTCYVGGLVLLLGLASLIRGWRWWHLLTLVCGWFALGANQWYQPSYWLADWPIFASTHVVTRWRFVAMLGIGLAVGDQLAVWRRSTNRLLRGLAVAFAIVIAVDLVSLAYRQFPLAFSLEAGPSSFPGPAVDTIVNVKEGLGYPCSMRGYGVIQGYEPMIGGYRRDAPTLRRSREDSDYRGEAWTSVGPISPTSWSPNQILFQVDPGQEIEINQNPGSWWWVNGRPAFPGMRCAEAMERFTVIADQNGRVVLEIRPRGLAMGLGLHGFGVVLIAASWFAMRRRESLPLCS